MYLLVRKFMRIDSKVRTIVYRRHLVVIRHARQDSRQQATAQAALFVDIPCLPFGFRVIKALALPCTRRNNVLYHSYDVNRASRQRCNSPRVSLYHFSNDRDNTERFQMRDYSLRIPSQSARLTFAINDTVDLITYSVAIYQGRYLAKFNYRK